MSDTGCTCPDENTRLASCPRHSAEARYNNTYCSELLARCVRAEEALRKIAIRPCQTFPEPGEDCITVPGVKVKCPICLATEALAAVGGNKPPEKQP